MTDKWVCLAINTQFHRGDLRLVASSVRRIFGKDLKEIRFVCNDVMRESGEYYCFVLCTDYSAHLHDLRDNSDYYRVVPCCDKPNFLTQEEVNGFLSSVESEMTPGSFMRGDLVLVKDGCMKNLYGLVVQKDKGKSYKVSFRFHLRRFMKSLPSSSMKVVDNLFKYKKFPVPRKVSGRSAGDCPSS